MKKISLLLLIILPIIFFACENDSVSIDGTKPEILFGTWLADYHPIVKQEGQVGETSEDEVDESRRIVERIYLTSKSGVWETTEYLNINSSWRLNNNSTITVKNWAYKNEILSMIIDIPKYGGGTQEYLITKTISYLTEDSFYVESIQGYFTKK